MTTNIRAKFTDGHIVPLQPLDIEEGADLSVQIRVRPARSPEERRRRTMSVVGAWKGRKDIEEMQRRLREARISGSREKPTP